MPKKVKFRVFLISNQSKQKKWQEVRDGRTIMTYTASYSNETGKWYLYNYLSTRKSDAILGDFMRSFEDLTHLCNYLGVPQPD